MGTNVYMVYVVIYSHLLPNVRDTFEGRRYSLSGIESGIQECNKYTSRCPAVANSASFL